jgi:hypothetical protein
MPFEALSVDERALKSLNIDHISQIVNLFGQPCFMVEKYSCHRRQKPPRREVRRTFRPASRRFIRYFTTF